MKWTAASVALLTVTVAACGSDSTGPDGDNSNSMSATVGGQPFSPPGLAVQATYTAGQGVLNFAGSHTTGGTTTMVLINLLGVNATGRYPLNPNFAGQFGQVTTSQGTVGSTATWSTALSPGTGEVNLTTLTATRAAGTFQFTGQAVPGSAATQQKTVTSGTFDVQF